MATSEIAPIQWPAPVLRVGLLFEGERWRIVRATRVPSMTLPAASVLPAGDRTVGFWVEVVDKENQVRYRRIMSDPLAGMEIFEDDGSVTRMHHKGHAVASEILVPELTDATELHLVSNSTRPGADKPDRAVLSLDDIADPRGDHNDH